MASEQAGNTPLEDSDLLILFGLHCVPENIDGNGTVDFADFLILAENFGKAEVDRFDGDFDGGDDIDFADFNRDRPDSSSNNGVGVTQIIPEALDLKACQRTA